MAVKVSVTVDDEVLTAARELAPNGNLSALVNDALAERVRRDRLRALLVADEQDLGEIPDAARAQVNGQWPFSSLTPAS